MRGQRTTIDRTSIDRAESVLEIPVRGIEGKKLRSSGKRRLAHVLHRLLDGSLLMGCPDGAGVRGKPIVCGKCKELRVPGGGVRIEDDGPGIVIEDRLRYSSDVMEKRDMGVNNIHQGFTGGEEGESIQ